MLQLTKTKYLKGLQCPRLLWFYDRKKLPKKTLAEKHKFEQGIEFEEFVKKLFPNGINLGDLGFIDQDGFLYINGRVTEMIKTGAFRVSPKEIEDVIAELTFVEEVAVCGVSDQLLGQVIIAFVKGAESESHARSILDHCRRSLSSYKLPKKIVWRNSMPKTTSGKLKKHALVKEWRA